jgi:hypothetical protein
MKILLTLLSTLLLMPINYAAEPVTFDARTARSGNWSAVETWVGVRVPQAGDFVQVSPGHAVVYDVHSDTALRMVHVAGQLTFSREKSTLIDVGLIKIEPGESTTEDGFECHASLPAAHHHGKQENVAIPVLEIGTRESPIPKELTATIRLRHFPGTSTETLPAIIACGGRWDVHGASLNRTWLKLAKPAKAGNSTITLEQEVNDWRVGDRIIITTGDSAGPGNGATFRQKTNRPKPVGTEECKITAIEGATLTLDRPLNKAHCGEGLMRCEVANLSRNVIIESAVPGGERGHTMYHNDSTGGISYAEFRHLGKEGILGKYAIHFHLVRETMRGSGVTGASIWDSHNRWITIHGTDHLLIRDCVGYQSRGHGFFLEDATEQWNILDRNLAVQAFNSFALPKQVLPYDPNDGAGFWWANGCNSFTRNVACENDRYGFHFQIAKTPEFNPEINLRGADGQVIRGDVRTIPFLRFEDNESHSEGLFDFRFGDEIPGSVSGDREHPFIVRKLRAWKSHYVIRPNVRYFLLDGLRVQDAGYAIYHPDYDAHVYRDIELDNVTAEPLNGGHDEESLPYGDFTYDRLSFKNCLLGRDPLIQLTAIGPKRGVAGHFREIKVQKSSSDNKCVVDFGGGPRTNKTEYPVNYYFHNGPNPNHVTRVGSIKTPAVAKDDAFQAIDDWTGPEARAAIVNNVPFPALLAPRDDVPPATMITGVQVVGKKHVIFGTSHDNGEIKAVTVNGQAAEILTQQAGVADWTITLDPPADGLFRALATDHAGNTEQMPHRIGKNLAE